jgi:hypothetical protein
MGVVVRPGLRVASVSVRGRPAVRCGFNAKRLELMAAVVDELTGAGEGEGWGPLDAVLWPGGYLHVDQPLAGLWGDERGRALEGSEVGEACRAAAARLGEGCGGAILVSGLRGPAVGRFSGEQLMAAWNAVGVTGSAAKVFPSSGDSATRRPLLVHLKAAEELSRSVQLPSGAIAALCVCYDAFAFAEARIGPTGKRSALQWVDDGSGPRRAEPHERRLWVERYVAFAERASPSLVLAAVHHFDQPGRETYWQRHGIATVSAALDGAMVVGAAHFEAALPKAEGSQGVLASARVEEDHLAMGLHRRAHRLTPLRAVRVSAPCELKLAALVRLYEQA